MSDQTIFGSTPDDSDKSNQVASNQQEEKTAEAPQENPFNDLLNKITTEDGRPKYAKVEDALSSIPHAQEHISKLEAEAAELRQMVKEMANNRMEERHPEEQKVQQGAALDENQVAGLVNQVLSQRETEQVSQRNVQSVVESLTNKFGNMEAAEKAYNAKAAELGISVDMMNSIARTSPQAVMAYFGSTGASAPARTEGTFNTANMPKSDQPRGKNPLLTGSIKDMQAEVERIKRELGY